MPANIYKNKAGKRIPGTTTIIGSNLGWSKNGLIHWAWDQGINGLDYRATRDRAADTGTIAHALVEAELRGEKVDWPGLAWKLGATDTEQIKQAESAFGAFVEWRDLVNFELLYSEHTIVHEELSYGGQIDVAAIQNKVSIIDLKTSKDVYPDHKIQISAYGQLYNYKHPEAPVEAYYILRIGKDGSFAYHYYPELENEWEAFKCLLKLNELKKII